MTAPFITVGARPRLCRIQPIMPVVVDLPLVPPTAMPVGAALNRRARSWGRVICLVPRRRAAWTSGTVSATAADVTSSRFGLVMDGKGVGSGKGGAGGLNY